MMPLHLQFLLGFSTQLVLFLILLNCSLLLALGLKLWCQARALPIPVCLATKISASKSICYFSSHPAAFGLQSSTLLDNITLTPANRKADKSLSAFQTGIGAAAYATLDMEQLISHLRVATVDTISPVPDSERGVICVRSS